MTAGEGTLHKQVRTMHMCLRPVKGAEGFALGCHATVEAILPQPEMITRVCCYWQWKLLPGIA